MALRDSLDDNETRYCLDVFSTITALAQRLNACPMHECCDGSCTGQDTIPRPSLSAPLGVSVQVRPSPRILPAGTLCHDEAWLADQQLEPFKYAPIDSRKATIRLLRIKSANFRKDVVECEILDMCLDDHPVFDALSYFWGPPDFDYQIICNGTLKSITRTLNSALKRFRQDTYRGERPLLWADALCINQEDKSELNAQLKFMHRIYSEAAVVDVDLGEANVSWYPGYNLLTKLSFIAESLGSESRRTPRELYKRYGLPDHMNNDWLAFLWVSSRPWFSRTWTIQEIILAKNAMVRFGEFTFSWKSLYQSTKLIQRLEMQPVHRESVRGLLHLEALGKIIELQSRPRSNSTLLSIMELTYDLDVSDSRDKINALVGLVGSQDTRSVPPFNADYTVPTATLYHRFGIHLIALGCAQRMLRVAGIQRRVLPFKALPSWVPDWSAQSPLICPMPVAGIRYTAYRATRDSEFSPPSITSTRNDEADVLVLMGQCIDSIAVLTNTWSLGESGKDEDNIAMIKKFLEWHESAKALRVMDDNKKFPKSAYLDPEEAFIRTILMDNLRTGRNASHLTSPITSPELTHRLVIKSLLANSKGIGKFELSGYKSMDEMATFQAQMLSTCTGRRFALTEKGRMGLVPHCAEVGDQVALVLGAPVPLKLRALKDQLHLRSKVEETLQLVGDTYIHGLMEGEGMDSDDFAAREIWIS